MRVCRALKVLDWDAYVDLEKDQEEVEMVMLQRRGFVKFSHGRAIPNQTDKHRSNSSDVAQPAAFGKNIPSVDTAGHGVNRQTVLLVLI